jgi:hypothetical protein
MHKLSLLSIMVTLGAIGCGSTPDEPPQNPAEELQLAIDPFSVAPGTEVQTCHEMALPSDVDVDIDRITWDFSLGSHHLHVYVSADGSTDAPRSTYDCFTAVDFDKWHLLVATQDEKLDWTLPEGTAFQVKARQSILLQTHYLNTAALETEGAVAAGGVKLRVAEPDAVERRAAAIFGQNREVYVPPHAEAHAEAECALPGAGELIAMTGHYHTHGRKFQTMIMHDGAEPELVYETVGFDEPVWTTFDDMRLVPGERFKWMCDYMNDLDQPLEFGPREDVEEHCNLFAFYTLEDRDAEFLPCVWEK